MLFTLLPGPMGVLRLPHWLPTWILILQNTLLVRVSSAPKFELSRLTCQSGSRVQTSRQEMIEDLEEMSKVRIVGAIPDYHLLISLAARLIKIYGLSNRC